MVDWLIASNEGFAAREDLAYSRPLKGLPATLARARRSLLPPPRLALSEWIESHVRLPEGATALPGPVRLFPYQAAIADAIGDPTLERVTLVKPVRVGFTTLLSAAIGHFVANDPAPVLVLQPAQADARDFVVSDLEPIFEATPVLQGLLADDDAGERNTLLSRRFAGGSLKVVAAKAPRNLRRHTPAYCSWTRPTPWCRVPRVRR